MVYRNDTTSAERSRRRNLRGALWGVLALWVMMASSQAGAGTAFDIVDGTGTAMGSITFPSNSGSSSDGVEFDFLGFSAADITVLSWALDPQTLALLSLHLQAFRGDDPCPGPPGVGCSKDTLTLTPTLAAEGHVQCPAVPEGQIGLCTAFASQRPIQFQAVVPTYACVGFGPPLDGDPVRVARNRVLPFKAVLVDAAGLEVTDDLLEPPPVIQVQYASGTGGMAVDVTSAALYAGHGTAGNQFVYSGSAWRFNLKVKNYVAPGTYTVTMASGDTVRYRVDPTCTAQFVVR